MKQVQELVQHVDKDVLVSHILEQFELKLGRTGELGIRSWDNSMLHMYRFLNGQNTPNGAGVAIEYRISYTSKRVDSLLPGHDGERDTVVIVELKKWSKVQKVVGERGNLQDCS